MATEKPRGRLARNYRLTWVDDSGFTASAINPPVSPARLAHLMVGGLAGTPVDAFVATVGQCAGYTLSYPTRVDGMEFLVDRLNAGAMLGGGVQWRGAENLRRLWADGHDPVRIVMDEAHRLGMDFWLQLRMNDWHHVDSEGKVYRLIGSDHYENHPELLIGAEGGGRLAGVPAGVAGLVPGLRPREGAPDPPGHRHRSDRALRRRRLGVRLHALPGPVQARSGAGTTPTWSPG